MSNKNIENSNWWEESYEAWIDMPQEAIEYLRSLPEFDAEEARRTAASAEEITVNGKRYRLIE